MRKVIVNSVIMCLSLSPSPFYCWHGYSCHGYAYRVVLMRQLLQMQAFVTQFDGHLQEIGKRVKEFSMSHKLNMQVVELLQRHVDTPATLELEWEELGLLSTHHTAKFTEVCWVDLLVL